MGPPQPEIMGLPGTFCLRIFGSRYKCGVLAVVSVVRNLWVMLSIMTCEGCRLVFLYLLIYLGLDPFGSFGNDLNNLIVYMLPSDKSP